MVEDDWELNEGICYALRKEGYFISSAHSLEEARKEYLAHTPTLVLLDVNLPDGEGFSFCGWMKEHREVPAVFLTARDWEEDVLKGYELGAQDYVTKPFSMKVLRKKIAVILQRTKAESFHGYEDGFLVVDLEKASVTVEGEECMLTPTEFRLLREFLAHKCQLLTYDVLLERVWDKGGLFVDRHTLAVNINRLRSKIERKEHKYISNVYGMGYQWIGE